MKRLSRILLIFTIIAVFCSGMIFANSITTNNSDVNIINEQDVSTSDGIVNDEQVIIKTQKGNSIKVFLSETVQGKVKKSELVELAKENESDNIGQINVYSVYEVKELKKYKEPIEKIKLQKDAEITPQWMWYDLIINCTTYYTRTSESFVRDDFIISVAKGATKSLTSTWSSTISSSVSGTAYASVSAGLTSSITCSHSKTETWSGPPESSSYNCREYRVKFYRYNGTWLQEATGWPSGHTSYYNGTFTEPSRYLEYSRDLNI